MKEASKTDVTILECAILLFHTSDTQQTQVSNLRVKAVCFCLAMINVAIYTKFLHQIKMEIKG